MGAEMVEPLPSVTPDAEQRDRYIDDLLGMMQAPLDLELTQRVRAALRSLSLAQVQALYELYYYCETH